MPCSAAGGNARGAHIVNLDDDGQNPPGEAVKLWQHAVREDLDVVYGDYEVKQHSPWRNAGSWLTNRVTDWALDKPAGFYLSSFRCVSGFVARQVVGYGGPYPYVDGLLLQVTQRIGSIGVRHEPRRAGRSGYTFKRLVRLWLSAWLNFSVLPLRLATFVGLLTAVAGVVAFAIVVWLWFLGRGPAYGWGWVMAGLLVFSGTQLVMLGPHRRISRTHVPDGQSTPAVRGSRGDERPRRVSQRATLRVLRLE